MKIVRRIVILLFLMCLLFLSAAPAWAVGIGVGGQNGPTVSQPAPLTLALVTAAAPVTVRTGPDKAYPSLGRIAPGQGVIAVALHSSREWVKISLGTGEGYVPAACLKLPGAASAPDFGSLPVEIPSSDPGTLGAAVATGRVNVRIGPGTEYPRLGKLKKGQIVAVWSLEGSWAQISWTGGPNAYVHTRYLRFEEDFSA